MQPQDQNVNGVAGETAPSTNATSTLVTVTTDAPVAARPRRNQLPLMIVALAGLGFAAFQVTQYQKSAAKAGRPDPLLNLFTADNSTGGCGLHSSAESACSQQSQCQMARAMAGGSSCSMSRGTCPSSAASSMSLASGSDAPSGCCSLSSSRAALAMAAVEEDAAMAGDSEDATEMTVVESEVDAVSADEPTVLAEVTEELATESASAATPVNVPVAPAQ